MNKKVGLGLIEELKNDSEKFCKERKPYQLLQEYFKGLSKDTLRELLYSKNNSIRRVAVWITSELGNDSIDLLKDVVQQINDDDSHIFFLALQIVAGHARGKYSDDFMKVFSFLEHSNQKTRTSVMIIISGLSRPRLHEAYVYMENKEIYNITHKKGLLFLLDTDILTSSEVTNMTDSNDAIMRKYGIIAAAKLYKKYPHIINEAVNSQYPDVREFAKIIVNSRNKN